MWQVMSLINEMSSEFTGGKIVHWWWWLNSWVTSIGNCTLKWW